MNDDIITITSGAVGNAGDYGIMTTSGIVPINSSVSANTMTIGPIGNITVGFDIDDFLDQHIMSRVTIDHKVQEQELMKLKEVAPDYANEIKENLAKDRKSTRLNSSHRL